MNRRNYNKNILIFFSFIYQTIAFLLSFIYLLVLLFISKASFISKSSLRLFTVCFLYFPLCIVVVVIKMFEFCFSLKVLSINYLYFS